MTDEDRPEETGPEAGPGTPPGARIFEEDTGGPRPLDGPAETADLVLDLDGYEGPLDVLLSLARDQKVDLTGKTQVALATAARAAPASLRSLDDKVDLAGKGKTRRGANGVAFVTGAYTDRF